MRPKLEIDTGSGFQTVDPTCRIKIDVDGETKLQFTYPRKPANRDELIEILEMVVEQLRPIDVQRVHVYRMM